METSDLLRGAQFIIGVAMGVAGLYFFIGRKGSEADQRKAKLLREESDYAVQQARDALTRAVEEITRRDEQIERMEERHKKEKEELERRVCEAEDGHGECQITGATLRASLRFLIELARQKRVIIPRDIEEASREPGSEVHRPLQPPNHPEGKQ